jgi:DNA (cytosine-5)-methyltransferase 1
MGRQDVETETLIPTNGGHFGVAHSLRGEGFDASEDGTGRGTPLVPVGFNARQDSDAWADRTGPLDTDGGTQAVAFQERGREDGRSLELGGDVAYALTAPNGGGRAQERNVLTPAMQVRRLTPRECERLQGFPDDYTLVPNRGKPAADGPRYKALGNSMAVPVMRWIGERIQGVQQ